MDTFRKFALNIAVFISFFSGLNAQQTYFEGVYSEKKIIINNPLSADLFGTCIHRITINGEIYPFNISDNYLEVDLSLLSIRKGELFSMTIDHESGCVPIIYNKNDFKFKEGVKFISLKADGNKLSWQSQSEVLLSSLLLELKFRDKWVKIAEISSNGMGNQNYEYIVPFLLSGKNQFRISKSNTKQYYYFPVIDMTEQHYKIASNSVTKHINIIKNNKPTVTCYELKDLHGVIVKKGIDGTIDVSNLKNGFYKLYFDTKEEVIIKK